VALEVKNEPLRLIMSGEERAFIHQRLRSSGRWLVAWLVAAALAVVLILSGALRHGEVPYAAQVDSAIAGSGALPQAGASGDDCPGTSFLYAGTRREVAFCAEDPRHEAFRDRLDAVREMHAWWRAVNWILIGVGALTLLRALIGAVAARIEISKYKRYKNDLKTFLQRYNREMPAG